MKRDPKKPNFPRSPLQLRKERIRELANDRLDLVAGGVKTATVTCNPTSE